MFIPRALVIEVASGCNARCPYCARTYLGHGNVNMSLELYTNILQEAVMLGIKDLRLYFWGEPTLNPQLTLFTELAYNSGFCVSLSSNGQLFNKYLDCLRYVNSVRFSVDGWDAVSYARHRVRLDFNKVLCNLRLAFNYRQEHGLKTQLSIGTVSGRDIDISKFIETWYGDGKTVDSIHFMSMTPYSVYNKEIKRFELKFNEEFLDKYFVFDKNEDIDVVRCGYLHDIICIGATGDMHLCCNDTSAEICQVNVAESGILGAYNSPIIGAIRQQHACGNFAMCAQGCSVFQKPCADFLDFRGRVLNIAKEKGLEHVIS